MITLKRIYEPAGKDDGFRVLVDRLWPRGISKEEADLDLWLKDVAPSNELRKWFGHDPAKWTEFEKRYKAELEDKKEQLVQLRSQAAKGHVTLLFAAKDTEHNNAVVLQKYLQ